MKQSGFTRKPYVTPPPAPPRRLTRPGIVAAIEPVARPAPKVKPVVSEAYRQLVRQLPCARCGHVGATQFCHADQDKGMGSKTDDRLGWAGCGPHDGTMGCHYLVGTSGHYPKERRRLLEEIYGRWTRQQIIEAGAWPEDLPLWSDAGGG
jgi:hypothetical protein